MSPSRLLISSRPEVINQIQGVEQAFLRHYEHIYNLLKSSDTHDSIRELKSQFDLHHLYDDLQSTEDSTKPYAFMITVAQFGLYEILLKLQELVDLALLEDYFDRVAKKLKFYSYSYKDYHFISSESSGEVVQFHLRLILCKLKLEKTLDFCRKNDILDEMQVENVNVYKNFSSPKGLCLIINNEKFNIHSSRTGTEVDEKMITNLFAKMGYQVESYRNLTASQMITAAREFSQRPEHAYAHSTVVVVMTHGEYDQLIGTDGEIIRLQEEFLYYFTSYMAPNLAGKPKLFFLQACRGHTNDPGHRVSIPVDYQDGKSKIRTKTDGFISSLAKTLSFRSSTPTSPTTEPMSMKLPPNLINVKKSTVTASKTTVTSSRVVITTGRPEIQVVRKVEDNVYGTATFVAKEPSMADFLVAYSTVPGFVSWRNSVNGSWFIQSICEVFSKEAAHCDILELLTKVNRRVAKVYETTGECSDFDRLLDEWEENDDEPLEEDEKPDHLRPKPDINIEELKKKAQGPDDLLRLTKKSQPVMMFVSVVENGKKAARPFTEKMSDIWQSQLYNNHIDLQTYVIEDDRILFMFKDGSRAWEGRDFLLKHKECKEVTLEGKTSEGAGAKVKTEL
ncbi:unnamed protein product [Bursaphelenchus okinawaensis]|uniref:Uncharacterized protein n=1 Tax=Bursaphelenchus okinawaensis TaxID=465554 RepID=A0A811KBH1_9BILA|nr:unnamed protein product [Bursaphelenchus okinawaensis]CAG9099263.1 unnamed protein product [Bursaphelenchus okinawaensis]